MKLLFLALILAVFSALPILEPVLANSCVSPCIVAQSANGTTTGLNTTGATLIVITCGHFAATCIAPTSSPANTFTGLTNYAQGTSNVSIWYKCGPATDAAQTFSQGQAGDTIAVAAYSGTATASCFDTGRDAGTTTTVNPAVTTITPSAASAGYLVVTAMSNCVNESPTLSDNQGNTILVATNLQNACSIENIYQGYRNYNSTSAIAISWAIAVDFAATTSAGFLGPGAGGYVSNPSIFAVGP